MTCLIISCVRCSSRSRSWCGSSCVYRSKCIYGSLACTRGGQSESRRSRCEAQCATRLQSDTRTEAQCATTRQQCATRQETPQTKEGTQGVDAMGCVDVTHALSAHAPDYLLHEHEHVADTTCSDTTFAYREVMERCRPLLLV